MAAGVPAGPATQPAAEPSAPEITRVTLASPDSSDERYYWLHRPTGHGRGQRPPLLICLHGTDDTARQMVDFWSARKTPVPLVIAAPQGVAPGWRADDLPTIRAMLADLERGVSYDKQRVLLAGFSAGGAMSLYLLYHERIPVTAAAALANYVPPGITDADVRARQHVPVFYAVGMSDLNQERMRVGLQRLRAAGANIDLYRPRIGHVLDERVAQATMAWFFEKTARRLAAIIEAADGTLPPDDDGVTGQAGPRAHPALCLEGIITQARWHEPGHVQQAVEVLQRLEIPGRKTLAAARAMAKRGRKIEAVDLLRGIEADYGVARLGREALAERTGIESNSTVRHALAAREIQRRADAALNLYAGAQRLVGQRRLDEAAARCRRIIRSYADTPGAARARTLLKLLEGRVTP